MERYTPFNAFNYLISGEVDLPLHNAIPNVNELLNNAHPLDQIALESVKTRYSTAITQGQSLLLSRNIECDPKEMLVEWNNLRGDAAKMLMYILDMDNFKRVMALPLSSSPVCVIGGVIPKYVWDFWAIVASAQFFLPFVSACKQKYVEVTNKNLSYANMLCLIENLLAEQYTDGWNYICSKVYQVVNDTASGELLAVFVLKGLTSISFHPNRYLDMRDIDTPIAMAMSGLREFQPKELPPNEMF